MLPLILFFLVIGCASTNHSNTSQSIEFTNRVDTYTATNPYPISLTNLSGGRQDYYVLGKVGEGTLGEAFVMISQDQTATAAVDGQVFETGNLSVLKKFKESPRSAKAFQLEKDFHSSATKLKIEHSGAAHFLIDGDAKQPVLVKKFVPYKKLTPALYRQYPEIVEDAVRRLFVSAALGLYEDIPVKISDLKPDNLLFKIENGRGVFIAVDGNAIFLSKERTLSLGVGEFSPENFQTSFAKYIDSTFADAAWIEYFDLKKVALKNLCLNGPA